MHNFRKLDVWHKARFFARDVVHLTASVRRAEDKITTSQLRRSALSIPALICEGCGKRTRPEALRYLDIANASAVESEGHLIQAIDIAILPVGDCERLIDEAIQIQRMLASLMRKLSGQLARAAVTNRVLREQLYHVLEYGVHDVLSTGLRTAVAVLQFKFSSRPQTCAWPLLAPASASPVP